MSQTQVNATELLCRVLERPRPEISGDALVGGEFGEAGAVLRRERILVHGTPLDWVNCPECRMGSARIVRELHQDSITVLCPECGEITAHRSVRETLTVPLKRFVAILGTGLGLSSLGVTAIVPDTCWRLGTTEVKRGKPRNWYFARRLHRGEVATRLREQIAQDKALESSVVLTSTDVPLPAGSVLTDLDVRTLTQVGRIGQSRFEFFDARNGAPQPQIPHEAHPDTTLRYVRGHSKVYIGGEAFPLEPRQQRLLLALIDDRDHEMDKEGLKVACNSQSQSFKPAGEFERKPLVYRTFVRFLRDDERYALVIPEEDRDWLH